MLSFDQTTIQNQVADSAVIFQRGCRLYENGAYMCTEAALEQGEFTYHVDGNYGDYTIEIALEKGGLHTSCNCPYPGPGCKHVVAVMLDVMDRLQGWSAGAADHEHAPPADWLSPEEIRHKALEDRRNRAHKEDFKLIRGEMVKGDHILETDRKSVV